MNVGCAAFGITQRHRRPTRLHPRVGQRLVLPGRYEPLPSSVTSRVLRNGLWSGPALAVGRVVVRVDRDRPPCLPSGVVPSLAVSWNVMSVFATRSGAVKRRLRGVRHHSASPSVRPSAPTCRSASGSRGRSCRSRPASRPGHSPPPTDRDRRSPSDASLSALTVIVTVSTEWRRPIARGQLERDVGVRDQIRRGKRRLRGVCDRSTSPSAHPSAPTCRSALWFSGSAAATSPSSVTNAVLRNRSGQRPASRLLVASSRSSTLTVKVCVATVSTDGVVDVDFDGQLERRCRLRG